MAFPTVGLLDPCAAMGYRRARTVGSNGRPRLGQPGEAALIPETLRRRAIALRPNSWRHIWLLVAALGGPACAGQQGEAAWPPQAKKWYERATASYSAGDVEDAQLAIDNALRLLPNEPDVQLVGARVALARLEYARVLELLEGVGGNEAASLRGRAYWYDAQLQLAADELEKLVADPEVRDPWAVDVAKLARRGIGREPFAMTGGLLAAVEMPRVQGTSLVVPVELNGEPALAMIATATSEVVVDASGSTDPKWVSLRFGERIEVKDVPAFAKDLSGVSRQLNAPIKVLLGSNLLRRIRPTIDFSGDQFVVRTFEPPPPPHATKVTVGFIKGGAMVVRPSVGQDETAPRLATLIDTSFGFAVALDEGGWKTAGRAVANLELVPGATNLRRGILPVMGIGAFQLPNVPAYYGAPIEQVEQSLGIDLDGMLGSEFIAAFRASLVDGGRTLWLEDLPSEMLPGAPSATQPEVPAAPARPELQAPVDATPLAPPPAGAKDQ